MRMKSLLPRVYKTVYLETNLQKKTLFSATLVFHFNLKIYSLRQ